MDKRLDKLANTLASQGVVGVSVPDWTNKSTWEVWYAGSTAVKAATDPKISSLVQAFDVTPIADDPIDQWDLISLKIAFNHENRIRALEGKVQITAEQFKTAVRAQL